MISLVLFGINCSCFKLSNFCKDQISRLYFYVVVKFYIWLKLYFPLFWGMVTLYDNEFKTKGN